MSDINENSIVEVVNSVIGEIKPIEEIKIEAVAVEPLKIAYDDIFVTENNTFDVQVNYYSKDGTLNVEGVDDSFSKDIPSRSLSITFKYPNQGDVSTISSVVSKNLTNGIEGLDMVTFNILEVARMSNLIRKWSIDKKITNEALMELNPKIVKGILAKVRGVIGTEGIF